MVCAPIVIPTMNRCKHLMRMIDSIEDNYSVIVENTELYISIDYPPDEVYMDGYHEVCRYVETQRKLWELRFKGVHIYTQERNLGPTPNWEFLLKKIEEEGYDKYIFVEDDNMLSTNALEFLNIELERFYDSDNIYAICTNGAMPSEHQIVKTTNFSAQCYGGWTKKYHLYDNKTTLDYLYKHFAKPKVLLKIVKENVGAFFELSAILKRRKERFVNEDGSVALIDQIVKVYLIQDGRYVICSSTQKAINFGYDGSGVNCSKTDYTPTKDVLDQSDRYIPTYEENLPICGIENIYDFRTIIRIVWDIVCVSLFVFTRKIWQN